MKRHAVPSTCPNATAVKFTFNAGTTNFARVMVTRP